MINGYILSVATKGEKLIQKDRLFFSNKRTMMSKLKDILEEYLVTNYRYYKHFLDYTNLKGYVKDMLSNIDIKPIYLPYRRFMSSKYQTQDLIESTKIKYVDCDTLLINILKDKVPERKMSYLVLSIGKAKNPTKDIIVDTFKCFMDIETNSGHPIHRRKSK